MDMEPKEGLSTSPAELPQPQPVPASLPPQQDGEQDAVAHPPTVSSFSSHNTPTGVNTNTTAPAPGTTVSAVGSPPEVSSMATTAVDINDGTRGGGENGEAGAAACLLYTSPSPRD